MKTIVAGDRMGGVLFDIQMERARQKDLLAQGKFPFDCDDPTIPDFAKLPVLAEEFGEASREVNEMMQPQFWFGRKYESEPPEMLASEASRIVTRRRKLLRAELIQVAAVCVAWCEGLDAQEEKCNTGIALAEAVLGKDGAESAAIGTVATASEWAAKVSHPGIDTCMCACINPEYGPTGLNDKVGRTCRHCKLVVR